jgi:hypothetical protein
VRVIFESDTRRAAARDEIMLMGQGEGCRSAAAASLWLLGEALRRWVCGKAKIDAADGFAQSARAQFE